MSKRATLTRAAIVEAGLRVLDRDGLSGLGMRAVARELGRAPMSLYRHVQNKDALVDLMRGRLFSGAETPHALLPAGEWRASIRAELNAVRAQLRRHPGAVWLLNSDAFLLARPRSAVDRMLQILRRAGLREDEAARTAALLWAHLVGAALAEHANVAAWPSEELSPAARLAWAGRLADPGIGAGPDLSAAAIQWIGLDHDTIFQLGLRLILDGIEGQLVNRGAGD